jgi:hypothetical protein
MCWNQLGATATKAEVWERDARVKREKRWEASTLYTPQCGLVGNSYAWSGTETFETSLPLQHRPIL